MEMWRKLDYQTFDKTKTETAFYSNISFNCNKKEFYTFVPLHPKSKHRGVTNEYHLHSQKFLLISLLKFLSPTNLKHKPMYKESKTFLSSPQTFFSTKKLSFPFRQIVIRGIHLKATFSKTSVSIPGMLRVLIWRDVDFCCAYPDETNESTGTCAC